MVGATSRVSSNGRTFSIRCYSMLENPGSNPGTCSTFKNSLPLCNASRDDAVARFALSNPRYKRWFGVCEQDCLQRKNVIMETWQANNGGKRGPLDLSHGHPSRMPLEERLCLPHGWVATRFPTTIVLEYLHPTGGSPLHSTGIPMPCNPTSLDELGVLARLAIAKELSK